jgi:hypothetical protein
LQKSVFVKNQKKKSIRILPGVSIGAAGYRSAAIKPDGSELQSACYARRVRPRETKIESIWDTIAVLRVACDRLSASLPSSKLLALAGKTRKMPCFLKILMSWRSLV